MGTVPTSTKIIGAALATAILTACLMFAFRFEVKFLLHRRLIEPAAQRYGVPPRLIAAVIWQESHFRARRVGQAGEIGLMQVMPRTAQDWARAEHLTNFRVAALFNPGTNVLAGTWYLSRALKRWAAKEDPLPYALAEYNAGPASARRWADRAGASSPAAFVNEIGYPTTQRYVREVLRLYRRFKRPTAQCPKRSK